ncbi:MAG: epoxyqueuosine reductase [Eubacteriales bacterium]|jgi:epoxyqueuosine reductase QueG|nr:epoxyqueuosine reductase [Eubacteriales bacterium]MDD3289701.1 epoxyqueuosine reductase [Eubacteriales bacterium]MDD3864480.1 epoxyqueuosine reductase [Eubacteriales bacterium]MDD4445745.1 epoxyqueuosine reductase [Eubacteriales bacterium]
MKDITTQVRELLLAQGADLVGFGDLSDISESDFPCGISIGIKLSGCIVKEIENGPTAGYHKAYHEINAKLNALASCAEEMLVSSGYKALANTTKNVIVLPENRTQLPHKTVAVRSALGWIGKSNLLITPQYGGAVRLTSVLTDAPLETAGEPMRSLCGDCEICRQLCPAQAILGNHWQPESDRDDMFRMKDCEATANRLSDKNFGVPDAGICGVCFANCPFTQRYLRCPDVSGG